jgi:thiamine kinase-like enzyme
MEKKQLGGGYINTVTLSPSGHVEKVFIDEMLTGVPALQRMRRETFALNHFGGIIAPALIKLADVSVYQQYVEGQTFREIMNENPKNEDCPKIAGRLLRQIHTPVHRPFQYLREEIEAKIKKYSAKSQTVVEHFLPGLPQIEIDWAEVQKLGSTRVHRDFWYGNIVKDKVIDWEFSGIGSPYEDFAIAELWIFMQYGGKEEFYKAYGQRPEEKTVREFLRLRCLQFLSTATIDTINSEDPNGEYFYHNIINTLNGGVYENRK